LNAVRSAVPLRWVCAIPAAVLGCAAAIALGASNAGTELRVALASKPNLTRGAEHFETCAACHGSDGAGARDGTVPSIAGQHYRVLVRQLVDFRHDKRWDLRMEHFADRHHLADAQAIADVAGYAAGLPRISSPGLADGTQLERGTRIYQLVCASCHGSQGEGSDRRGVPRLAGQHQGYLMRQIQDAADHRRPNMEGEHAALIRRSLSYEDIVGVADYLARLRLPTP
jgi:cytochrome c553